MGFGWYIFFGVEILGVGYGFNMAGIYRCIVDINSEEFGCYPVPNLE
jgi:hypothetical protein